MTIEDITREVRKLIDQAGLQAIEEYEEFLDWLASEVEMREESLGEIGMEDEE